MNIKVDWKNASKALYVLYASILIPTFLYLTYIVLTYP